jgi:hypothetical protein
MSNAVLVWKDKRMIGQIVWRDGEFAGMHFFRDLDPLLLSRMTQIIHPAPK